MRPVDLSRTLADSHWKCAPSKVPGRAEPRPRQLFGSGRPSVIRQPPCCSRSSSAAPLSNSWLPTDVKSTPTWLSASTAGSSKNRADTSGDAPTKSPPPTTTLFGSCAFSRATQAASASAPPAATRGPSELAPKRPGDCSVPWKSLNAMILAWTGAGAGAVAQPVASSAAAASTAKARSRDAGV